LRFINSHIAFFTPNSEFYQEQSKRSSIVLFLIQMTC